jgi:hypothetical protein
MSADLDMVLSQARNLQTWPCIKADAFPRDSALAWDPFCRACLREFFYFLLFLKITTPCFAQMSEVVFQFRSQNLRPLKMVE